MIGQALDTYWSFLNGFGIETIFEVFIVYLLIVTSPLLFALLTRNPFVISEVRGRVLASIGISFLPVIGALFVVILLMQSYWIVFKHVLFIAVDDDVVSHNDSPSENNWGGYRGGLDRNRYLDESKIKPLKNGGYKP
jgi:hypothetical protein